MLYLAQVSKQGDVEEVCLRLLARQKSEHFWALASSDDIVIEAPQATDYSQGSLVLVELSPGRKIEAVHDATDWVLDIVSKYLTTGITPEVLHQEAERVEEWRQDLTLQNQDVARRALEIETRRDQIQELEKKLEQERKHLESVMARMNEAGLSVDSSQTPLSDSAEQEVST